MSFRIYHGNIKLFSTEKKGLARQIYSELNRKSINGRRCNERINSLKYEKILYETMNNMMAPELKYLMVTFDKM